MAAIRLKIKGNGWGGSGTIEEQMDFDDMCKRFPLIKLDELYLETEQDEKGITKFTHRKEESTGQTLRAWLRENTELQIPAA